MEGQDHHLLDGNQEQEPESTLSPDSDIITLLKACASARIMPAIPDQGDHPSMIVWINQLNQFLGQYYRKIDVTDGLYWFNNPEIRELFTVVDVEHCSQSEATPASSPSSSPPTSISPPPPPTDECTVTTTVEAPKKRKKSELENLLESNTYGVDNLVPRKKFRRIQ